MRIMEYYLCSVSSVTGLFCLSARILVTYVDVMDLPDFNLGPLQLLFVCIDVILVFVNVFLCDRYIHLIKIYIGLQVQ